MERYQREEMVGWMMNGVNHNNRKGVKWMDEWIQEGA